MSSLPICLKVIERNGKYSYVVEMVSEGHFVVAMSAHWFCVSYRVYSFVIIDRKIPLKYSN